MGLFSKKKSVTAIKIPQEILDDVSVNGEKNQKPAVAKQSAVSTEVPQESTSPFLNKPPVKEKEQEIKETPKPFQFSDQIASTEAVHFAESTAAGNKKKEHPVPSEPTKKVPDFSRITEDPTLQGRETTPRETLMEQKKIFLSKGNIISVIVFFLILTLISGGSWYYLNTRSAINTESTTESINELEVLTEEAQQKGLQTIATDQPNYLRLDVESIRLADIKLILEEEAQKIQAEGITVPVEYLVTDLNNNPVAFSRFALLTNANVPDTLVNASKEPFSVYLFEEEGSLQVALAVALDEIKSTGLENQVNELAQSLKGLLLAEAEQVALPSALTFNQADYNNQKIYYYNLTVQSGTSFDITFEEQHVIIANNKDLLRAVFDKRN
jgi:hypothetical protein